MGHLSTGNGARHLKSQAEITGSGRIRSPESKRLPNRAKTARRYANRESPSSQPHRAHIKKYHLKACSFAALHPPATQCLKAYIISQGACRTASTHTSQFVSQATSRPITDHTLLFSKTYSFHSLGYYEWECMTWVARNNRSVQGSGYRQFET